MKSLERSPILVVEDDPADVFRIRRAFDKVNLAHLLSVVSDGEQAIDYLSGQKLYQDRELYPFPALVLLDLKLPRCSGFEVLSWLRQEPQIKHLPVVILTSSDQPADIDRAYAAGANSYLAKPPSPAVLLEMIQAVKLYWIGFNHSPHIKLR